MTSGHVGPAIPSPLRGAVLWWRIAFVAYAVALTTATHWPRLEIGSDRFPAPDKQLHLVAFAVLAVGFWRARWIRRTRLFALILVAWACLDELTQGLPGLGREISVHDLAASVLGVMVVVVWRAALQPIGGAANRERLADTSYAFEHVFTRPRSWLLFVASGLIGAVFLGTPVAALVRFGIEASPLDAALLGLVAGGTVGAHVCVTALWRREYDRLRERRPCTRCGCDTLGDAEACPGCGAPLWPGRWSPRLELTRAKLLRLARRPVLTATGLFAVLLIGYLVLVVLHPHLSTIGSLTRAYHRLPAGLRLDIDVAALAMTTALGVRLFRRRLAAVFDGQHRRCMHCDHDVHAVPNDGRSGRCSECGHEFHLPPDATTPT